MLNKTRRPHCNRFKSRSDKKYISPIGSIKIYHKFVDMIDNSVPKVTVWRQEAPPSDAGHHSDPRDKVVYSLFNLKLDSFSCILLTARAHPLSFECLYCS